MYCYAAYDLSICSEFELPELPATDVPPEHCDVSFVRGDVEPVPDSVEAFSGRRIEATPEICRLTYESIGTFAVESGERVVADPLSEDVLDREFFRRLFENELLGLLLYQRDHLVLHASAVSVDGRGVIFLGPRGAGKSTTAAAFEVNGYPMLEDDVVAVRFDDGTPMVVPGVPQLRLRPDAAEALGVTESSTPSEESWYDKRFLEVGERVGPVPLNRCYVLGDGDEVTIEPMEGTEKMLELISQTHARGLLSDTDHSPTHFEQCARVLDTVGFRSLLRPRDHSLLPSIVERVVDDVTSETLDRRA